MNSMKEVPAQLNYLRMSPRKVREVADVIRGRPVQAAQEYLKFLSKSPRAPLEKLLKSAVHNAKHNYGLEPEKLFIKELRVDGGPTLKRQMPRAFGRAFPIRKRSSHITLVLGEKI